MTYDEYRKIERQIIDLWLANEINHNQAKKIIDIIHNEVEEDNGT